MMPCAEHAFGDPQGSRRCQRSARSPRYRLEGKCTQMNKTLPGVRTTDAEIDAAIKRGRRALHHAVVRASYDKRADRVVLVFNDKTEVRLPRRTLKGSRARRRRSSHRSRSRAPELESSGVRSMSRTTCRAYSWASSERAPGCPSSRAAPAAKARREKQRPRVRTVQRVDGRLQK